VPTILAGSLFWTVGTLSLCPPYDSGCRTIPE
jgi:hypothetical protein